MSLRDYAVPVIAGLIAALLIAWWSPEPPELGPQLPEVPESSPYVLHPRASAEGDTSTLLYLGGSPRHGISSIVDIRGGLVDNGTWRWDGSDHVCLQGGDCLSGDDRLALQDGAVGHFDASKPANMTFFIFTSKGRLLSTNTPISVWGEYDLDPEFTHIGGQRWWFGEGPTPLGSQQVPEFRPMARALLEDVPVGGVRSILLEHHDYEWLVGPLWVTARVDGV